MNPFAGLNALVDLGNAYSLIRSVRRLVQEVAPYVDHNGVQNF